LWRKKPPGTGGHFFAGLFLDPGFSRGQAEYLDGIFSSQVAALYAALDGMKKVDLKK
jgi:hypothetical protein